MTNLICECEHPIPQATLSYACQNCYKVLRQYAAVIETPRRNRMDKWHSVELSIYGIIQTIEQMEASTFLTSAQGKLSEAKDLVADWYDEKLKLMILKDNQVWCIEGVFDNQIYWWTGNIPAMPWYPTDKPPRSWTTNFDEAKKFKTKDEASQENFLYKMGGIITGHLYTTSDNKTKGDGENL